MTKQEIKRRISIYEDNMKYWQKQKKNIEVQLRIAKNEISNCKEHIKKYKAELKQI